MMLLAAAAIPCAGACGKRTDVPGGALLLDLFPPAAGPSPDELRVSVYDDAGVVFKSAWILQTGALVLEVATSTALITWPSEPGIPHFK